MSRLSDLRRCGSGLPGVDLLTLALIFYLAGLVASSAITYRNADTGEVSFVLAAVAQLMWPLSFLVVIACASAPEPIDDPWE